jgi:hypothetical protein
MRTRIIGGVAVLGVTCAVAAVTLRASDRIGVYAVVERVVLEPNEAAPLRAQIWGAFALADRTSKDTYGEARRGYLYYTCPQGKETLCRNEWSDLKSVAGKDTGVGFGARLQPTGRIRSADEAPASPDPYPLSMGVMRLPAGHDSLSVIDRIKTVLRSR